jgi:hypothetical protein
MIKIKKEEVEFRKAEEGDIPSLMELINKRWDRKVSEQELSNRIKHGVEFVSAHKPTGKVIGQMSGIITKDFKPSWVEHIGGGDIQKRSDKNGRIFTLYQLTVDPEVRVEGARISEELRNHHLNHIQSHAQTLDVKTGFSKILGKFISKKFEVRTHSPIQDLNEMLFKNEKFKNHVQNKLKVRLNDESDFFKLPGKTQKLIALERLYYTEPLINKSEVKDEKQNEKLSNLQKRLLEKTKDHFQTLRIMEAALDDRPDAFDRFKKENKDLIKKLKKIYNGKFGIEEFIDLTQRKAEPTLRFHASGGARIDKVIPNGSEEKTRSLGVAVSYLYSNP